MSLTRTHKEYILNKVLLDYLKQGIVPDSDTLEEALDSYMDNHPNLSEPQSKYTDFDIERGSNSSASAVESAAKIISDDVGIIVQELRNLVGVNRKFYERWSYEVQRLLRKSKRLEARIDSLLLLEEDTAGFFAHVGDVFTDLNLVNTVSTTARVDVKENLTVINPKAYSSTGNSSLINLSKLTIHDISFSVLTRRPGTTYNSINDLTNLFNYSNEMWVGQVSSQSGGSMTCEIKIRASQYSDLEVSKVLFEYAGSDINGNTSITCQYSIDGYTWYLVPTDFATKTISSMNVWYFPLTKMRWIKLIVNKNTHDEGQHLYNFSGKHFQLYGQSYSKDEGNIFVTKSLEAKDVQDNPIMFSSLSLEVCEEIPKNTNIEYYLAASQDNDIWTDWFRVLPATTEGAGLFPKILDIGGFTDVDNLYSDVNIFNTSHTNTTAALELTKEFDSFYSGYTFLTTDQAAVNTSVEFNVGTDPNIIANSIAVWRNIYYRDPSSLFTNRKVREIASGWGLKDNYYSCFFEVIKEDITLDFGDKIGILDDQEITGAVLISRGIHKFSTLADNWYDINEVALATVTGNIMDEATFEKIDILYPYNHKLIIEGFPYPNAFVGEKVYKGVETVAQNYAKKTSLFNLENNIDKEDYKWFATRSVGTSANPALAVILNRNTNTSDYTNELCRIKWKAGSEDSLYRYVKMKAILTTEDVGITPSFESYRIKLGL